MPALESLTVRELIEQLQAFPPDMPVVLSASARDYWRTTLALSVSEVSEAEVTYSGYHEEFTVPREDAESDDERVSAVLLS